MQTLVLLRGVPGSGKSSWIAAHNLQEYTIESDAVRLMFQAPVQDIRTGVPYITQKNDAAVWAFILDRIHERMHHGEFIILDAQNADVSKYVELAKKHFYKVVVVQFPMMCAEVLKQRNSERLPIYKRLPEEAIDHCIKKMKSINVESISGVEVYTPETFELCYLHSDTPYDFAVPAEEYGYNKIVFIGDIHGCYEPLRAYFEQHPMVSHTLYVFLGDYLDRGIQNDEVMQFLLTIRFNSNCVFLAGNHIWEYYWATDQMTEEVKSSEFILNTLPQIQNFDKQEVCTLCGRMQNYFCVKLGNELYIATHAGIGFIPGKRMTMLPSKLFTKGDSYKDDVDRMFEDAVKSSNLPYVVNQVHGHRNLYKYADDAFEHSYNLCNPVEFGEPLRIMEVTKDSKTVLEYPNSVWSGKPNEWEVGKRQVQKSYISDTQAFLVSLRTMTGIKEKFLEDGVSSFNFDRDVFFSHNWNELRMVARGLFLDSYTGQIVARSWPKFFNLGEGDVTLEKVLNTVVYPVHAYLKYNGFLGILSSRNGQFFFATKSTTDGQYVEWFKQIFNETVSERVKSDILEYLINNNVTMLFEVMDPVHDPHIVEYNWSQLRLLEVVHNTIDFKVSDDMQRFISDRQCFDGQILTKMKGPICYNEGELVDFINEVQKDDGLMSMEGYVLEDSNNFRFKLKTPYYLKWKKLRSIKERIQKGKEVSIGELSEDAQAVVEYMKSLPAERLSEMSIIDVRNALVHSDDAETKGIE